MTILGDTLLGDLDHYGLQYKNMCDFKKYEGWSHFCEVLVGYLWNMYVDDKDYPPGKYRIDLHKDVLMLVDMDGFKLNYEDTWGNYLFIRIFISCSKEEE